MRLLKYASAPRCRSDPCYFYRAIFHWAKNLLVAGFTLFFIIVLLRIAYYIPKFPESIHSRNSPTNFSSLLRCSSEDDCWRAAVSGHPIHRNIEERFRIGKIIDRNLAGMKNIALDEEKGQEILLRSFSNGPAVIFNPLPKSVKEVFDFKADQWPLGIAAAVAINLTLLGNWRNDQDTDDSRNPGPALLPILDFFLFCDDFGCSEPKWYQSSPLMSLWTVQNFISNIRTSTPLSYRALDVQFRPAFDRLLHTLAWLHGHGMCHDFISPKSLYIASNSENTTWYLGNFNHVREISHPFHYSRLWSAEDAWPDCRLNDVRRALKSYLSFLRGACNDTDAFDQALFGGTEPWSRLYWRFIRDPVVAEELIALSDIEKPELKQIIVSEFLGKEPGWVPLRIFWDENKVRAAAAELEVSVGSGDLAETRRQRIEFAGWWIEDVSIMGETIGSGNKSLIEEVDG